MIFKITKKSKEKNCRARTGIITTQHGKIKTPNFMPVATKAAVKALGLVYGGVDVAIGRDGTAYVLEVNSAPALNEPNMDRWAILFKNYIERGV